MHLPALVLLATISSTIAANLNAPSPPLNIDHECCIISAATKDFAELIDFAQAAQPVCFETIGTDYSILHLIAKDPKKDWVANCVGHVDDRTEGILPKLKYKCFEFYHERDNLCNNIPRS